jgi:Penicillinase repressor
MVKPIYTAVHKFTPLWDLTDLGRTAGLALRKKIRIELEDEGGTKYTLALEGSVSREKLMKAMDMLEIMDLPLEHTVRAPDEGTFLGRVMTLLETTFAGGDFSSSDVARAFEEKYGQPVKLSTISTYLSRLTDKQYIKRERFGNSWVYRRIYLKQSQVAER